MHWGARRTLAHGVDTRDGTGRSHPPARVITASTPCPSSLPRTRSTLVGDEVADELIMVQRILSSWQFRRIPADQLNLIVASNGQLPTVS